ncbi:MAG: endonuclease/exonuclease/phosphatase family protein [Actinomycetota bacterium]|jgi:exonuclease III|nr:endonuclease/exonuclease/phosphatase family protein [Actinomycetota bacterium]
MRVITWNVARRSSRLAEQAAALASRELDVVALKEVTDATLPLWRAVLERIGLPHIRASLDSAGSLRAPASRRRTGVLVGSRAALRGPSVTLPVPWGESALAAVADTAIGPVEIHCLHVPNAANGWVKAHTHQAVRAGLQLAPRMGRVVCGDLNTPRRELENGEVVSFARDSGGRLRPERGSVWDEAELGVVPGLRDLGYRDAYRCLHGHGSREPSWTWRRIAGHGGGWRLDHLFTSAELRPVRCLYHHAWRDEGLSDHSALEAEMVRSE